VFPSEIKNVLSLRLVSIELPNAWYLISEKYKNNYFQITIQEETTNTNHVFDILVPDGNYDSDTLSYFLNTTYFYLSPNDTLLKNIEFKIDNFNFKSKFKLMENRNLYSFDIKFVNNLSQNFMNTLGWLMGFRLPYVFVQTTGNNAPIPINLNGTSYFLLALMDYQTNRINNDIVTIVNKNNSQIMLPNYINASLLYKCINTKNNVPNIINEDSVDRILFNQTSVNTKIKQFIPSAPRILTQSQLYTTNEILKNNLKKTVDYRSSGPTTNDVLALIPVNTQGVKDGNVYIQDKIRTNKRVFFGPVNIDRFTVRLINDRGQLVNLNGSDWSFTLNVEILYQI
jgi:hypothetical protein